MLGRFFRSAQPDNPAPVLPGGEWLETAISLTEGMPGVLVDVGAHIGAISRALARGVPGAEVYAYEPVSENFSRLEQKSSSFPSIHPIQAALSDTEGELELFLSDESVTHSLEPSLNRDMYGRGTETIRRVRLDDEANRLGWDAIRILKVDAEGHDLHVLDGAAELFEASAVAVTVVECGFSERFVDLIALRENLAARGMLLHGIYDQNLHWSGRKELEYFNALFLRKDLTEA